MTSFSVSLLHQLHSLTPSEEGAAEGSWLPLLETLRIATLCLLLLNLKSNIQSLLALCLVSTSSSGKYLALQLLFHYVHQLVANCLKTRFKDKSKDVEMFSPV